MPQYSFTSTKELVEDEIQKIADREGRSRSDMINILLQLAVKEKTRKRNAKKVYIERNASDVYTDNS